MKPHPQVLVSLRREFSNLDLWKTRLIVLAFAGLAGMTVVFFTWITDLALSWFRSINVQAWWGPLLWTPICTVCIVWVTHRFARGCEGSGIPQVMAALNPSAIPPWRALFVSIRLTVAKILLTAWGLLAGLSLGREGPSVQVAAGVMHSARHWLPRKNAVSEHGLLIAGGAAGIAAAFNTPLGGIMFAIEELSRKPEQRSNGLIMAAIVLSGLMAVSVYGNSTYFGVIHAESFSWTLLGPGLLIAILSGLSGGLFSRLLIVCLSGTSPDIWTRLRQRRPVMFAGGCGLAVAILGVISHGETFGTGYVTTRNMLEGSGSPSTFYVLLKFLATWITAWSGVPGGIFAPSLAIGAALGNDIANLLAQPQVSTLIALGMVGFLAAATQAPMTSFIIVMEMVDGHSMVLSLMACALVSSGASRLISAPLYSSLAALQVRRIPDQSAY
jgi:H+/Cl- antiporter ClcA